MKDITIETASLRAAEGSARTACARNFAFLVTSVMICSGCFNAYPWRVDAAEMQPFIGHPQPPMWPETFHAVAVQNRTGSLALVDLYYEWNKGRNANLIHSQLGTTLYDIE